MDKTGASSEGGVPAESSANNGLGFNGEFRIGSITIAVAGDKGLRLRHTNVGVETEVAEAVIEGILEDAFFTRKVEADGNVKTKLDDTKKKA